MQPKLRFKDFNDEWEKIKLKNIAKYRTQKNNDFKYLNVLTNSAELGIINQLNFFDNNTKISNKKNINGYYIVYNNDFVYNPRISKLAPYGPIRRNKLGKAGIVSPLYLVFTLNNELDISFIEYYFKSDKWYKYIYKNGDTGARSDRVAIKKNILLEMPIYISNKKEQEKIANLLNTVDQLIEQADKQLKQYQSLKKFLLQKLFANGEQKQPPLRFKGFTDEWQEKKLGEISKIYDGVHQTPPYSSKGIPF